MSRIHEALKRAEQERAASAAPEPIVAPAEMSGLATYTLEPAPPPPAPVVVTPPAPAETKRFENLREQCPQVEWKPNPNVVVFHGAHEGSNAAEQFRTLRSRLYRMREKNPLRTLLVTSAVPGEGKTFVAVNLAHAIVRQHERRVLLIDADLRAPMVHSALGAARTPGLTDYLQGKAADAEIVSCERGGNLFFIPAGSPVSNPAELLADDRMKSLLTRLAQNFDWIILDTPPALPVADASSLASHCDGVLLIVQAGSTPCQLSLKVVEEFRKRKLVGVVLNQTKENGASGGYYSYPYSGQGLKG